MATERSGRNNDVMASAERASDMADFAALLADRTRAAMCLTLLDGRAWTAGELAEETGVAASTATEHLNRLLKAGMLHEYRQGRNRYVTLAGADIAEFLDSMNTMSRPGRRPPAGLPSGEAGRLLARGRTCHDHVAGELGIAVTDAMIEHDLINLAGGFSLSPAGFAWFDERLSVDTSEWSLSRRTVVRECLDWTQRRSHMAGIAGAEMCRTFLKRGWIRRTGCGRAVGVTSEGVRPLRDLLGIDAEGLGMT